MTAPSPRGRAALPLSRARHVDQRCDQFEAAWQAAGQGSAIPRLEDYVTGVPEPEHGILLRELLVLDLDYRRRAGQQPQAAEYLARFPALDPAWLAQELAGAR